MSAKTQNNMGTILIVDDNKENLYLLSEMLTDQGYKIRAVINGQEALASVNAEPPDLILLDIKLPDINGYDVCAALMANEKTCVIPVIFISAFIETSEKLHGFEVGAVDYITKPYRTEEVLIRVKTHLEINRMRLQLGHFANELQLKNDQLRVEVNERRLAAEKLLISKTAALNLLEDLKIEIEQRKKNEEAIRISEEKFRNVFEHSVVGKSLTTIEGKLKVNDAFCQMLGYTENELSNLKWQQITHNDDIENDQKIINSIISGEKTAVRWEKRYIHKNGNTVWVDISTSLQRDNEGNPLHFITAVIDISEKKHSEDLKARLLHILESSLNEIYVFDPVSLKFEYVNKGALQNLGYTQEEMKNMTPLDLKPEFTEAAFRQAIAPLLNCTQEQLLFYTVHRRADSSLYPVEVHLQLVEHEGYRVFLSVILDITERKQAEENLKENHSLLRIAGEKAKLGGWNVNLAENRSYWSDEVAAIHEMPAGYSPLVEDGINFYAPEWRDRITKVFTDCAQKGITYDEEMQIITSTGKRVWIRTIGEAVRDEKNNIVKVQGAFQDISDRKQAEEKILQQLEDLKRWQNVTIGREDRNRQLKGEVNELLKRLGEKIRYPSQQSGVTKDK